MILILLALLMALIIGAIVLVALCGWASGVTRLQRVGLTMTAAGLLMAAPGRYLGNPPDLGDLIFLAGLALYVVSTYGRQLWRRADEEFGGKLPGGEPPKL